MMFSFDDTTTIEADDDEDKTLILNGSERLKYFSAAEQTQHKPLAQKTGFFARLKRLFS